MRDHDTLASPLARPWLRGMAGAVALALICACTPLPQGGGGAGQTAPRLLPLDDLLAAAGPAVQAGDAGSSALAARAARLRARAALMRGPVMEPDTRARLDAAIRAGQA